MTSAADPERLAADEFARRKAGLILIAHGSRLPAANLDLFELGDRLLEIGFEWVFPAFLELAEPTIQQAGADCVAAGAKIVVLAPYFLSAGRHAADDLEVFRTTLAASFPHVRFLLAAPLGPHPGLDAILVERARAALARGDG